jgi:hypothetical protein
MSRGPTRTAWTAEELSGLRTHVRVTAAAFDLKATAEWMGRSAADTNLALDALLGRSPAEAARALNALQGERPVWGPGGRLTAFLAEVFG